MLIHLMRKGDLLSIEKIPRCPFCKAKMKIQLSITGLEGIGTIILKTKDVQLERDSVKDIVSSIGLTMFFCEGCGFVAFWNGEP